ncbi:MAG: hypothetical protein NVS2B16_28800 [Chloroflexota bacterium]
MGENAGEWSGRPLAALLAMHHAMIDEGPCGSTECRGTLLHEHAHYLNLVNPLYRRIGIGIAVVNKTTWLTEDFSD